MMRKTSPKESSFDHGRSYLKLGMIFLIIYGIGGQDENLPGPDDDILTEWSLARPEAVAEARSVTVITNAKHGDIVHHYKTFHTIKKILDAAFAAENQKEVVSSEATETVQ